MEAPQLSLASFITQRLERNSDFDRITVGGHSSLRLHHDVDTEIIIGPFGEKSVLLNSQGIEEKLVSSSSIVKGVEQQADDVVVKNTVALGDRGADLGRIIVSMKRKVDETRIIAGQHFGAR